MKLLTPVLSLLTLSLAIATRAQAYPPAWNPFSTYATGDEVQLRGNTLRAIHPVAPGDFKYDHWELWEVRANTDVIIGAGQTFVNLEDGWNYLKNARVADGVFLHVVILTSKGSFSESFSSPFSLDHSSGARVSVIGDDASKIQLNFSYAGDGMVLDSGHTLADLEGITINAPVAGSNFGSGIHVLGNATLVNAAKVNVNHFDFGLTAETHGIATFNDSVSVQSFALGAAYATTGGALNFQSAVNAVGETGGSLFGFRAWSGGSIFADDCSVSKCNFGFQAELGGSITAVQSLVTGDSASFSTNAYFAASAGTIDCAGSSANGTFSGAPWQASSAGFLYCTGFFGTPEQISTTLAGSSQPGFVEYKE